MTITKNNSQTLNFDRNVTDLIKFISCLMIAMHHYSQYVCTQGSNNLIYKLFSEQGGWLGVAIFFFLSGYGLMKSELKHHSAPILFVKKRLMKTYFPAILVSLVWGLYLVVGGESWSFNGVFWKFNDTVLWFVRAIICLYTLFYFYIWVRHTYRNRKLNNLVLTIIAIGSSVLLYVTKIVSYPIHAASVPLFFLGVAIAEHSETALRIVKKRYPIVITFLLLAALVLVFRQNMYIIHCCIDYLVILIGIVFFALYEVKLSKLPGWIGDASYDMYLVHNKAKMILVGNIEFVPLWAFAGLAFVFTILFYFFRNLVERLLTYIHI